MTTNTTPTTATPCPSWCIIEHDGSGQEFHAGTSHVAGNIVSSRLWQDDDPGATPGVVIAGQLLTGEQARALGLALVHAADQLAPATPEELAVIQAALSGTAVTLDDVAVSCGVDGPQAATRADVRRFGRHVAALASGR